MLFQLHNRFCPSRDTPHAAFHHVFILLAARPRSRSIVGGPMADQARWNCIGIPVHPGILKPPPRCDGDANGNYGIQGCTGRFPRITEYYHEMDERGSNIWKWGPSPSCENYTCTNPLIGCATIPDVSSPAFPGDNSALAAFASGPAKTPKTPTRLGQRLKASARSLEDKAFIGLDNVNVLPSPIREDEYECLVQIESRWKSKKTQRHALVRLCQK